MVAEDMFRDRVLLPWVTIVDIRVRELNVLRWDGRRGVKVKIIIALLSVINVEGSVRVSPPLQLDMKLVERVRIHNLLLWGIRLVAMVRPPNVLPLGIRRRYTIRIFKVLQLVIQLGQIIKITLPLLLV